MMIEKYIVYKLSPEVYSGQFFVITIAEAFESIGSHGTDLPNLKIEGAPVNQEEAKLKLSDSDLLRLTFKGQEWIITNID